MRNALANSGHLRLKLSDADDLEYKSRADPTTDLKILTLVYIYPQSLSRRGKVDNLDHFPPLQEFHHQLPQAFLAIRQPMIAVEEEVELDLLEGAASGEIGDAPPGD